MIEKDTIELLRECNAGVKMGMSAIDEVIDNVQDQHFRTLLSDARKKHHQLGSETRTLLNRYHDSGKEPGILASGMSRIKTGVMMTVDKSDATAADLITDGCNMGVKSLHRYLNQYKAAEEDAKDIAKRLVNIEERLAIDIRTYL